MPQSSIYLLYFIQWAWCLQDIKLLSPQFLTTVKMTIENVSWLCTLINDKQREAFTDKELFPHTIKTLALLREETTEIVPECRTHNDTVANLHNSHTLFHDSLLSGNKIDSLDEVIYEITEIFDNLEEWLTQCYSPSVNDEFFTATTKFLDTESYIHAEFNDLYQNVTIIKERYTDMFVANGCDFDCLKAEYRILVSQLTKFLSKSSPDNCWPQLFKLKVLQ